MTINTSGAESVGTSPRPPPGSESACARYPTALRDAGLNAATRSGVGMPRSMGCGAQNDFGADEEFGLAAQIVGNHAYATASGVGFVAHLNPTALRDAGLNAAPHSGVGMPRAVGCGAKTILVQTKNLGLAALIVGNHAYATRAGVEIGYRLVPHGAARRGAKCRDPLRGRDAASTTEVTRG